MIKTSESRHPYRQRRRHHLRHGNTELALPDVEVSETDGIRSMHLGSETVQSSMDLDAPERLVLSYSRAMMAWLLFNDEPRRILQIGLGGGSFARWIAHYLPNTESIAVDIHPQVISVAKMMFELPPEDELFKIIEADGASYIRIFRDSCDAILVDAFDGFNIIEQLTQATFFEDCRRALTPNGVFVANWWSADPRYISYLERLLEVFDGRVIEVPTTSHGNIAVMAFRSTPAECNLEALSRRALTLEARFRLEFDTFVATLDKNNICTNGNLIL